MKVFYSDTHDLNLPDGHRFPGRKYVMLRKLLIEERIIPENWLTSSPILSVDEILIAHDADYVEAMESGTIDPSAMRRIGLPWSPTIPVRARATAGGALAAAREALGEGISGQLAGGTHHAHAGFGAGYCVYNDFAIAALMLLKEKTVSRIAIIDLDVHQGDGNAAILGSRSDVFILSVQGAKNFPFRKVAATLDVDLPDNIGDEEYLAALEPALEQVWRFEPDLILYQAGVDPLEVDRLGRMALSYEGLKARDESVLRGAKERNIAVSMAIGGGYADPIEQTVRAYANTWCVAREVHGW